MNCLFNVIIIIVLSYVHRYEYQTCFTDAANIMRPFKQTVKYLMQFIQGSKIC